MKSSITFWGNHVGRQQTLDVRLLDEDFVADRRIRYDALLTKVLQAPFGNVQRLADFFLSQSLVGLVRLAQRTKALHTLADAMEQGAHFVVSSRFDHFTFHS